MDMPEPILRALDQSCGQPLRLTDARTGQLYLLVPADLFERIHYAEDDNGLESREVAALIANIMREDDEDDPALESYQEHGKPQ